LRNGICGTRGHLNVFGLTRHLKEIKGIEVDKFPRMTYEHAMKTYGTTNQTFVSEWSLIECGTKNNEFLFSMQQN
jgi:aspartyl-tRNA synthetase